MTNARNPYEEVIKVILDHPELNRSEILLYLAVASIGGEGRISMLAEAMKMPRNTAVLAAKRLEAAGLCDRTKGIIKIRSII